jgi:hypothetical protein
MSDFFTRLAARTLGHTETLKPVTPFRFEPSATPELSGWPKQEVGEAQSATRRTREPHSTPPAGDLVDLDIQPAADVDLREPDRTSARGPDTPASSPAAEARSPETRRQAQASQQLKSGQEEAPTGDAPQQVLRSRPAKETAEQAEPKVTDHEPPQPCERSMSERASAPRTRVRHVSIMEPLVPLLADTTRQTSAVQAVPRQATAAAESSSAPAIQVTIGRVEVRAVTPQPAPHRPLRRPEGPLLSLEDYVAQRREGRR